MPRRGSKRLSAKRRSAYTSPKRSGNMRSRYRKTFSEGLYRAQPQDIIIDHIIMNEFMRLNTFFSQRTYESWIKYKNISRVCDFLRYLISVEFPVSIDEINRILKYFEVDQYEELYPIDGYVLSALTLVQREVQPGEPLAQGVIGADGLLQPISELVYDGTQYVSQPLQQSAQSPQGASTAAASSQPQQQPPVGSPIATIPPGRIVNQNPIVRLRATSRRGLVRTMSWSSGDGGDE